MTNEDESEKVNRSSKAAGLKGDKRDNKQDIKDEDPQLQEFLEIMQLRSKSKLWANDTLTAPSLAQIKKDSNKQSRKKKQSQSKLDTDDSELDEIGKEEDTSDGEKLETHDAPRNDEVLSDMDYFKSRVRKDWSESESSEEDGSDNDSEAGGAKRSEDANAGSILEPDDTEEMLNDGFSQPNNEALDSADPSSSVKDENDLESGRLFVRNLPYTTTEEELEEHFRRFGNVSQVHIVVDKDTKRSKGFAYVLYALPESASRALTELDHSIFQGRLLHVMPAKQKISSEKIK